MNNIKLIRDKVFEKHNNIDELQTKNATFLQTFFCLLEDNEVDELEIIDSYNESLNIEVTGYFYNTDDSSITIYISLFNEQLEVDTDIEKDRFDDICQKFENLILISKSKKYHSIDENSVLHELCEEIDKNKNKEIILTLVTNYRVPSILQPDTVYSIEGTDVARRVIDIDILSTKLDSNMGDELNLDLENKFGRGINAILISSNKDFDIYLTSFSGQWLAQLYKEDSIRLLSANVRSYLKKTNKVNKEIITTVKEYPQEFVAYNNGLSAIATNINFHEKNDGFFTIKSLENFQIVNGGQTTATLFECLNEKLDVSTVLVPAKLAVIKNTSSSDELISNISTFSNLQSAIKKSDPPSNNPFFKRFEELSSSIWANGGSGNHHCFFERTSGQYNTMKRMNTKKNDTFITNNPEKKKFTKIQLAQAIVSWEQQPSIVSLGQEKNFGFLNNIVKDFSNEITEEYFKSAYALIILYRKLDTLIKKRKLQPKGNVVIYSLSYLSLITDKKLNLMKIWDLQDVDAENTKLLDDLICVVHEAINDSPTNYPDIRMWARKNECWDNVKKIKTNYNFDLVEDNVVFFPVNSSKVFIDIDSNFKNSSLWKLLLIWDDEKNILSDRQKNFIKGVPNMIFKDKMTKKQVDYAKSIFNIAVKEGFEYEGVN